MKYYIIPNEDAVMLGVTSFRKGNVAKGFVVNAGDMATASEEIRNRAREVTEAEAVKFIKEL